MECEYRIELRNAHDFVRYEGDIEFEKNGFTMILDSTKYNWFCFRGFDSALITRIKHYKYTYLSRVEFSTLEVKGNLLYFYFYAERH